MIYFKLDVWLIKGNYSVQCSYDTTYLTYAIPLIIGEIKAFIREQSPIKT